MKVHCATCILLTGLKVFKGNGRGEVVNYDRTILALSPEDAESASEGAWVAVGWRACVVVFFVFPLSATFLQKPP